MGGSVMDKLTPAGAILHQLGKRLQWKDWIVVLKAMIVFHRIFQDGNPGFVSFLAHNASNIFRFHGCIEQTSDAVMNMPLILSYSQYLERWCVTKQKIDWPERIHDASPYAMPAMGFMPPGMNGLQASVPPPSYGRDVSSTSSGRVRGPSRFQECDFLQLVEEVPYLQDNLDLLLAVRLEFSNSNSPPARGAVRLCLRDLVELLPALANAVQNLVEQFYNVDTPEILESAFEIYRRYLDQDIGVAQYLKLCQSLGLNQAMPNVARPSQNILDEMFDHMERVKMGDIPRIRGDELDSNDQEISSDNLEGEASQTQSAPDSLKETGAQTASIVDVNASKTVGSGPEAAPMNKSVNVAATQTEESNQVLVSRRIPAIAQTSSTAAPALEQTSTFQEEEEAQNPREEREHASRRSVREKAAPALENREPSKPKEFDLLALLEGSSDSDEQIASESDSSASESLRRDVQGGSSGVATGSRSGKQRGENVKPSLRQQKPELEVSAPNYRVVRSSPCKLRGSTRIRFSGRLRNVSTTTATYVWSVLWHASRHVWPARVPATVYSTTNAICTAAGTPFARRFCERSSNVFPSNHAAAASNAAVSVHHGPVPCTCSTSPIILWSSDAS
ncbi:Clathrin assembly protein [Cyanidiococcus yangmingshanensis]|uniref:Clathrin assembly protein n=1 Tax=Cyanidiococcus yangmingshanensis TaxID=2690220 RepID=A0A7J7ICV5_9RHOD|nr:Clathrin assembly protein [Cyanidiococcus yangmingshanensis]